MNSSKDWKAVGDDIEGLALKLKLHFEQDAPESRDDMQTAVKAAADGVEAAFEGLRAAVKDPAVKQDVKDVAVGLRDALANTLSELSARLDR